MPLRERAEVQALLWEVIGAGSTAGSLAQPVASRLRTPPVPRLCRGQHDSARDDPNSALRRPLIPPATTLIPRSAGPLIPPATTLIPHSEDPLTWPAIILSPRSVFVPPTKSVPYLSSTLPPAAPAARLASAA